MFTFDKRHLLFALASLSTLVILYQVRPISLNPSIKAVLSKQRGSIKTIDTPRDISSSKTYYLDTIDFQNSTTLIHKRLGPLGYSDDFFIDFEANVEVSEEGDYVFSIRSDDGFRLFIDGKKVSEWLGDRPVATTDANAFLTGGKHTITLSYFQGYGNLGLSASYRKVGGSTYMLGQSSRYLKFIEFKK